ncbi:MAG: ABC transporter ATP-binding protein [Miniphocaeibacter sp.]|uniref:ATP-binding cassette domain-containing protein n=1 Tax=Miniphocaeibacter sp. TaxID=3100973 RepID=UPI0017D7C1FF|nr:ABC transporter ATP-binding protein [Gallicola sp.]
MNSIVQISNLTKKYNNNLALDNLNLELKNGTVVGLLGPNGSGKTTLIKILAGLLRSYSGEVLIDGEAPGPITKAYVSYLPDRSILNNFNKISDSIKFFEDFFEDFNTSKCKNILNSLALNEDSKIKSLSKGMVEKLHLSLILARKAKLYILDEPIAGVDPVARDEILNAIIDNIEPESTMIISTHLVRDIENIFDEVAFISNGKIIEYDIAENIRTQSGISIDEKYKEIFGGVYND